MTATYPPPLTVGPGAAFPSQPNSRP